MAAKGMSLSARWTAVAMAFAIALFGRFAPVPEAIATIGGATLTSDGLTAMGVLLFTLLLWLTEAIPFHITGLLGIILLALFGVDSFSTVVSIGFGNHIVAFFIGVLVLSSFITSSGLGNRISVFLLSRTGNRTSVILLGFMTVGALISAWITDTAVAAMLMPLGAAILKEEGVEPLKSNFGKALMISCAWGPTVGGIMTPAGAGPNPIAIGFLQEMAGVELSFLGWMMFGVPAGLLILVPTWGVLMLVFPPEMKRLKKTRAEMQEEYQRLPPMQREEKITLWIFLATVTLWLTTPIWEGLLGIAIPISLPVLLTASIFFFPGVATTPWAKVEKDVSWSSIILILSGISLGMVLYRTGAAEWLAIATLGGIGSLHPFVLVLLVVVIVSLIKIFLSSNTVTASIMIPIMITLAGAVGLDALTVTMPAALTASMAFIMVTSTPTNVIPYTAGYFSIRDFAFGGLIVSLVSAPIVAAVIYGIGLMTGLY
ncbi:MAG: DASS family sodium-coupled anion symporter [Spirochaetaceae bacterium]|nr:MAG: DASS family sodium-coupled anion symporter [Spirochaetaceae bacterium]